MLTLYLCICCGWSASNALEYTPYNYSVPSLLSVQGFRSVWKHCDFASLSFAAWLLRPRLGPTTADRVFLALQSTGSSRRLVVQHVVRLRVESGEGRIGAFPGSDHERYHLAVTSGPLVTDQQEGLCFPNYMVTSRPCVLNCNVLSFDIL